MDLVHDKGVHGPGPYFDGPSPRTQSTEGVHGLGVHVLYFPVGERADLLMNIVLPSFLRASKKNTLFIISINIGIKALRRS